MKSMSVFLLLLIPVLGWGQSFDSVVDFDLELSSLSNPVVARLAAEEGRVVILEGLMGDTKTDESGAEAQIWVTLIGGSWIGTSEVRAYSCRILFRGNQWLDIFPGVRPEMPTSDYVPPGSRLLIAARVTGYDRSTEISVAEMVDYRVLQ